MHKLQQVSPGNLELVPCKLAGATHEATSKRHHRSTDRLKT